MKESKELERADIAIDREMEVDCNIGQEFCEKFSNEEQTMGGQT